MPTIKAVIKKGMPTCPKCGYMYTPDDKHDFGVDGDRGYWFTFVCSTCSASKKGKKGKVKSTPKTLVKYFADNDFRLIQRKGDI